MLADSTVLETVNKLIASGEWHYSDPSLFSKFLSYEENLTVGCDLPKQEGVPVIIYDFARSNYLIGRILKHSDTQQLTIFDTGQNP